MFNEKYAVSSRPEGNRSYGANLWGYGVFPPERPWDDGKELPDDSLHVAPFSARCGFVNRSGPAPTAWTGEEPWKCRCMLKPELGQAPTEAHPLKLQSFSDGVIFMTMADGSVHSATDGVADPA